MKDPSWTVPCSQQDEPMAAADPTGPQGALTQQVTSGAALTSDSVSVSLADVLVLVVRGIAFPAERKGTMKKAAPKPTPTPLTGVIRAQRVG